ncbi:MULTISPECIES: phosphoribosyl-AMP cyclohydrolase [unclassified Desulfurobacterium]|uniref:phosphoribosyl-AMP cyclohydrolase n=1 Tax=Desulfurobacterium sp. TC5-1 TaxID=1158318 RepID=UPI000412CAFE|nr:phosphoribosyl-AMP cyclohydrolase [Desulfurobacterium sp. TC5-1]
MWRCDIKVNRELLEKINFDKGNGLVPVVVQDAKTKDVLMVAYANRKAVEETLKTGFAHYFSRSRNELWMKGKTSGHVQKVKSVLIDCDEDTLLYIVEQTGVACHTGNWSCFYRTLAEGDER